MSRPASSFQVLNWLQTGLRDGSSAKPLGGARGSVEILCSARVDHHWRPVVQNFPNQSSEDYVLLSCDKMPMTVYSLSHSIWPFFEMAY